MSSERPRELVSLNAAASSAVKAGPVGDAAISLRQVNKAYRLFNKSQDRLKHMLLWRFGRSYGNEFHALNDVTFDVYHGETVGIVGRNGSGKSTLLQIISGTLRPTSGEVAVNGRVAALLELGSGFNHEYTGRENIHLNAALLGLSQADLDDRFDAITRFADIGAFIDQPLKMYSSGMNARLAFAVAIHTEPDILIIDEALSVGDEAFQRKCFAQIERIKKRGATILFVSHSGSSIVELCDRAVLLEGGRRLLTGAPRLVMGKYHKLVHTAQGQMKEILEEINAADTTTSVLNSDSTTVSKAASAQAISIDRPSDDLVAMYDPGLKSQSALEYFVRGVRISNPRIESTNGQPLNILLEGADYACCYEIEFLEDCEAVRWGNLFKTVLGSELGGLWSHPQGAFEAHVARGTHVRVCLPFRCNLAPATYFMNVGVYGTAQNETGFLHRMVDCFVFKVVMSAALPFCGPVDFRCAPLSSNEDVK